MKRFVWAALAALVVVSFAVPAFAQVDPGPKFATHIQAHSQKAALICTSESPSDTTTGDPTACSSYDTRFPTMMNADLYVVVAQADSEGVSGASFGLDYDGEPGSGVDIYGFEACFTGILFESETWPDAGSGARLTWLLPDDCQDQVIGSDGVHAVVGAFYVYAYDEDRFLITPNRTLSGDRSELLITNCGGGEVVLDTLDTAKSGFVDFGGVATGCNPCVERCDPTPVEKSTWGKIKHRYVRN